MELHERVLDHKTEWGNVRLDEREFIALGELSQDIGFNILARILEGSIGFHQDCFQKYGEKKT